MPVDRVRRATMDSEDSARRVTDVQASSVSTIHSTDRAKTAFANDHFHRLFVATSFRCASPASAISRKRLLSHYPELIPAEVQHPKRDGDRLRSISAPTTSQDTALQTRSKSEEDQSSAARGDAALRFAVTRTPSDWDSKHSSLAIATSASTADSRSGDDLIVTDQSGYHGRKHRLAGEVKHVSILHNCCFPVRVNSPALRIVIDGGLCLRGHQLVVKTGEVGPL